MPDGNIVAALALVLLLPATIAAFTMWRPTVATLAILVGAMLFLPERSAFDLPLFPQLDKYRIATLCCLVAQVVVARREHQRARLMRGKDWIILLSVPVAQVGTMLTNLDPLVYGGTVLPAMGPKEMIGGIVGTALDYTGPFLLGRLVFRSREDAYDLLKALAAGGVLYVPFMFIEFKFGPVCHLFMYGFLQHSVEQTIRGVGFRPMVFMSHGLALALMMFTATAACCIVARSSRGKILGLPAWIAASGLAVLFPFIKSSAALTYTVVAVVTIIALRPRTQLNVALGINVLACLYMVLQLFDCFPDWTILRIIGRLTNAERIESLGYRWWNEGSLILRAWERGVFGWGGWGRNSVYDSFGTTHSVKDGAWIIIFGSGGLVLLVLVFGLLIMPGLLARRVQSRVEPSAQRILGGLSIIVSLTMVDLLPNGAFNSEQMFLAGALAGLAWGMSEERKHPLLPLLIGWHSLRRQRGTIGVGHEGRKSVGPVEPQGQSNQCGTDVSS